MLNIALKEWAVVCDLLLSGELSLLLRKGGIHETSGPGVFELEHSRFALFPSWMHQKPAMLRPGVRERVEVFEREPAAVPIAGIGQVARIWMVRDRSVLDEGGALHELHPWTREQIDMRVNYRPENPLYLMAVRGYRLPMVRTVANVPAYAGCKSWVPLSEQDTIDDTAAAASVSDERFSALLTAVDRAMGR
jgi:hypothetical protein